MNPQRRLTLIFPTIFLFIGLYASPAFAHKINLFATADGQQIEGYAYAAGGQRIIGQSITVSSTDGKELATLTTDEQGNFSYKAQAMIDHLFVLETTDGHAAQFTVRAEELQGTLVEIPPSTPASTTIKTNGTASQPSANPPQKPQPDIVLTTQVRLLREEIQTLREETRLRDILGGIGYLIGITGIAFYFLGTNRKQSVPNNSSQENEK